jgi:2',3'-cyclic-nucleotide 2'-phosphodiesterase/3'-nucleotidase/5'-nucleotidase
MNPKSTRILTISLVLTLMVLLFGLGSVTAQPLASPDAVQITVLQTNDFHGYLESDSSGRGGSAYMAGKINEIRAAVGADNVLLVDAGDEYFGGAPISALAMGESTIDIFNMMGYEVATYGNHEFDKGQEVLQERTAQSDYPWLGANIVLEGTDWDLPSWAQPYVIIEKGGVKVGIIGVDTDETPLVTLKGTTDGLVFKDLTQTILHYYDEVKAQSDALIVMAHMGTADSGPYKGLKTVAQELINAGKPVDLIIGGHQHEPLSSPVMVGNTAIVQAGYYGRWLGRADVTIDPATKSLTLDNWQLITINNTLTPDPAVEARVAYWSEQVAPLLEQPVGTTNVSLVRDYNAGSNVGDLVADSMLWKADEYDDGTVNGSVQIAFTNAGGLRADVTVPAGATLPYTLTWGDTFSILPFGNTLFLMDLTGAQVQALLDQSATLFKGILQSGGISYYWYNDCGCNAPTAWGAYNVKVGGQPLKRDKVYRVVTNNFLATGGDNFTTFNQGTNRWDTYYDMQQGFNEWIAANSPVNNPPDFDQRIVKLDNVVTILHTNDEHGRAYTDSYRGTPQGLTYLYSLVKKERAHNPNALLLSAGDTIQGNAFAFYFRDAPGPTPGGITDLPNPLMAAMNMMGYDAFAVGNHEYNFGSEVFVKALSQANFPVLGANVTDDGRYGLAQVPVEDYIVKDVSGVKVAIIGITNPRVPSYELPSNIVGLTFYGGFDTLRTMVPEVRSTENPDLLVALNHIGYSGYEGGSEADTDQAVAQGMSGIDVIVGGHSHTKLDPAVMITSAANPNGTLVAQAQSYAAYLGKINVGFIDGQIVFREGYLIPASEATADPDLEALLAPHLAAYQAYNSQVIGESLVTLDATTAYTEETGAGDLQVDASIEKLWQEGAAVDVHLSGAMTNQKVPAGTLTVGDMFTLMPYENSLVAMHMNGPQLKRVLERSYWNWWQYYYRTGSGSRYTTCFLLPSAGSQIMYDNSRAPDGDNVVAFYINGQPVDFTDGETYYNVSTVNYVAAGACNFTDAGQTLWPLDQITADTQYYVRDVVIDYVKAHTPVAPQAENRIVFASPQEMTITPAAGMMGYADSLERSKNYFGSGYLWTGEDTRPKNPRTLHGAFQVNLASALPQDAVITGAYVELTGRDMTYENGQIQSTLSLNLLDSSVDSMWPTISYYYLHNAHTVASVSLANYQFSVGGVNRFDFDQAAVQDLQMQLDGDGLVSFRTDGKIQAPYGRDIVGWDGRAVDPPVLHVTFYAP